MQSLPTRALQVSADHSPSLAAIDPADTSLCPDRTEAEARLEHNRERMAELQERLYAEGRRSVLLVVQAMDTAGKDSTIAAVTTGLNPQGCRVTPFKAPSADERAHDFLWRVHAHTPAAGMIAVFNRSHYEDVLTARVHATVPADLIHRRYGHINDWERMLADHGTEIVKVFLHISPEYQAKRLRRRLERPDKHWKFDPADLVDRRRWPDYMAAYETVLARCSTPHAPWHVVPAEHKWYRSLLVSELLLAALRRIDPQYPAPKFDAADYTAEMIR